MATRKRTWAERCLRGVGSGVTLLGVLLFVVAPVRADIIPQELFALTLSQELGNEVFEAEDAMRFLEENYVSPAGGFDPKAIINEEFVREMELAVQRAASMGLFEVDRTLGVVALVLQSHLEYELIGALQEQVPLPAIQREAPIGKYQQIRKGQAPIGEVLR